MNTPQKTTLPITLSTLWITLSEFLRNEILFKTYWTKHYSSLGLTFETKPINGIIWLIWSFLLAYLIFSLLQHLSFKKTLLLSWLTSFVMMWLTLYNLQVLPLALLLFAIPLSALEVFIAAAIIRYFQQKPEKKENKP
ncbi:MAG: hypothetical protein WCP97_02385 [bacterium]